MKACFVAKQTRISVMREAVSFYGRLCLLGDGVSCTGVQLTMSFLGVSGKRVFLFCRYTVHGDVENVAGRKNAQWDENPHRLFEFRAS